ncbi:MAG TPA: SusC/RagA family TonB-linked outer membrane protein, partial [Bacteroidales bacterium]|nr:SusC/RagA family TonB-linked outer membrane protein [Bacteroidales bacterium]
MRSKKILVFLSFLIMAGALFAQSKVSVSGTVTELIEKTPLVGVTVYDKNNPGTGTITDNDGRYTINVPGTTTLVFTYLGFLTEEIQVNGRTSIDIALSPDIEELQEVVVVGTSMKKSDLTGSVVRISSDKLKELPVTNVNQALQGRMAGVYIQRSPVPGENASIKIRGNNSIQFGTSPIYVVDGIVLDGGFNLVNPDDIATIDVLKDASATALYGSRGANGVVVITTKKGSKGGSVSYDGWMGFSEFTKTMPLMNARQIYDLRVDAYANAYMDANPTADRQAYINNSLLGDNSIAFADYEKEAIAQGKSYNWLDEVTRSGFQQNHSLSFSGASDKTNYYMSFGASQQDGLIKNSDYTRYTGKVNMEHNVKKWLKIGTNTSYARTKEGLAEGSVFTNAMLANPMYAVNDTDTYMKWADLIQTGTHNPLKSLTITGDRNQNRLTSANFVNINPVDGLNIRNTLSIDVMNQQEFWYIPKDVGQSIQNSLDGEATQRKDNWLNWEWDASVSYDKTFGKHRVSALVATNISKNDWNYNQLNARGFASDDFKYMYVNGATLKDKFLLYSDFTISTLVAYVQRVNYSFANKYYATVTIREEGSSKISKDYRWGTFPSVALGWNISEENFMKGFSAISLLKLRAGYGIVGNQNIPLYANYSLYRPNVSNNTVSYVSDGRLGNNELKWEEQKQMNIGLDLNLFANRLSLVADYYFVNNDNLLMQRSLSSVTGFTNTISNVGSLENKGLELTANVAVVDAKDLKWNLSGNISFNKNKITKLYGDVDVLWNKGGWTGVEIQREGNLFLNKPLNSIYVYTFDKIAQESDMAYVNSLDLGGRFVRPGDILPKDINDDKIINDLDRSVVGNTDPKFYGGFSTDVSFKGVGLNAIFNYSYGGKRIS